MLGSVTAVAIVFGLAELWLHVTVMCKIVIGAQSVCHMSGLFSLAVVTGHQRTRHNKAFQTCLHALTLLLKS